MQEIDPSLVKRRLSAMGPDGWQSISAGNLPGLRATPIESIAGPAKMMGSQASMDSLDCTVTRSDMVNLPPLSMHNTLNTSDLAGQVMLSWPPQPSEYTLHPRLSHVISPT